jgi:hypothetical protein
LVQVFIGSGSRASREATAGPPLHQRYTFDEAVAAFEPAGTAEFLCDQQFVILPKAVLCMATIGDPATQAHVAAPSSVVWKPGRTDYAPSDEFPWLPDKVREIWGADRKRVKEHYVFLRRPGDASFLYAGRAHLGRYAGPENGGVPPDREASFSLDEKLPRDEWLRLGGYPGWLIEANHRSEPVDNGDLSAFRRLAAEIADLMFSHLCMTRFEEDSLTLFTNAYCGWLTYQRDPADFGASGCNPSLSGSATSRELFRCGCGVELDIPADHTLPRQVAMRIAEEFFTVGELPQSVRWISQ